MADEFIYLFIFKFLFIYLFLAALGLRCCARVFSSCSERGLLFVAVHRLLIAVASRCVARALGTWTSGVVARGVRSCGSRSLEHRLSSCGARAQLLRGMWDLPGPGLEPVSSALAGGFFFFFLTFFFFLILCIYLFIFGCAGSSFLCEGFLQLRQAGTTLHGCEQASHYRGLSCRGAQAPDAQAQ